MGRGLVVKSAMWGKRRGCDVQSDVVCVFAFLGTEENARREGWGWLLSPPSSSTLGEDPGKQPMVRCLCQLSGAALNKLFVL